MIQHLFNSNGIWLAFRDGRLIYDTMGKNVAFLPWDDSNDVLTLRGGYVGTVCPSSCNSYEEAQGADIDAIGGTARLYRFTDRPFGRFPIPQTPANKHVYPGHPGIADPDILPLCASDVSVPIKNKDY